MPIVDEPTRSVAEFRPSARAVLRAACLSAGRQTVLLSWPGGATYLPSRCFEPSPYDAVVGHVVGCPVYADRRQLGLFVDSKVVVDAPQAKHDKFVPLSVRVEHLSDAPELDEKFAAIAEALADELTVRLAGQADRADIGEQVRIALDDLRGSVSFDSLAEIAVRLAEHRLSCAGRLPR